MPLAHKSFGEGTPIIFIHGWELANTYDIADFEPIFTKLPGSGYRRIYIDLPGMGATPADKSITDLQSMLNEIVTFIERHIAPSKFLLVGTSLGGYLARALATQFGEQILGVLLKVPLIEPENSRRDLDVFDPVVEDAEAVRSVVGEGRDFSSLGQILVQTPAYIRLLLAKLSTSVWPADALTDSGVLDPIRNDPKKYSLELIESGREAVFSKPALIINGRHDDVVGYRDSLRLLGLYPRATFIVLDRGIHLLPVDEGELVQSLVLDWLRRVEEFSRKEHAGGRVE